jgi:hypothetical protein
MKAIILLLGMLALVMGCQSYPDRHQDNSNAAYQHHDYTPAQQQPLQRRFDRQF